MFTKRSRFLNESRAGSSTGRRVLRWIANALADGIVWACCRLIGHYYHPVVETRQLRTVRCTRYHIRHEHRFHCVRCRRPTKWMNWRELEKFEEKHRPDWA